MWKIIWRSILQARNFLDPSEIFKGEIEETIEKVRKACNVLDAYRNTYEDHKERLKSYFPEGTEPRLWEFAPKLVFARYDKFVERVKTVRVSFKRSYKSCESIVWELCFELNANNAGFSECLLNDDVDFSDYFPRN